jgi:hypothetical protein
MYICYWINNFDSIYFILAYLSIAFLFLSAIICLYLFNYTFKDFLFIALLIFVSIVTEIISYIMIKYLDMSNLLIYNIHTILELFLISAFYYQNLEGIKLKKSIIIFNLLFLTYQIIELKIKSKNSLNEVSLIFESLYVIVFSILTFYQILHKKFQKNLFDSSIFWFNSAFLIYFSGNLFIYLFSAFLNNYYKKVFHEMWGYHSILSIILYSLISIGFWKTKPSNI